MMIVKNFNHHCDISKVQQVMHLSLKKISEVSDA